MSRELGRLMSSLTLARRQVWLAPSPLSEASRRALRTLPVVPGQLFGVAAQQALERTLQVTQARQQFASLRQAPPRSRRPAVSTTMVPPIPRPLTPAGAPLPEGWCQACHQEPTRCPIPVILDFLQSRLDDGLAPSTIKVYIAAISARHNRVDGVTVGSNTLVSHFLKGAQRLRPPQRSPRASWDLPLVLQVLGKPPFEPLGGSELKWLSMKTAFLLAMASAKRVGELHALSVSQECIHWSPDGTGLTLWPNPSFLPKTFSALYVNQPLSLAALKPPTEDGGQTHGETLLCPVRTLRAYIEMTAGFQQSDSLFVCHTGHRRGHALSKRLSNWIAETICYAYTSSGHPVPSRRPFYSGGGGGGGGSDIVGSLAGCPTLRHLCCALMGLALHICEILQTQCGHL
ncbi:hypothetical protein N1851_023132 [Merluccius polli]|uniref:Core-binding (CB) domain-containing protein n=1 Tax=Merluccius polli TaxID=89951 RepID=A0AA47MH52_MERPO|nr:hypothetical protein N1851_023132 [Merluccius polli]